MDMKVLHVWNTSGVASVIAKFMDRLYGTKSLVVHRRAFDPFGVTTYGELWDCSAMTFKGKCLLLARKFDVIHVHALDEFVPYLKLLYPNKPVILHYHGSDIREQMVGEAEILEQSRHHIILYTRPTG